MVKKHTSQILALLLSAAMLIASLGGCSSQPAQPTGESVPPTGTLNENAENNNNLFDIPDFTIDVSGAVTPAYPYSGVLTTSTGDLVARNNEKISYVMIYNPGIYTAENPAALQTGNIGSQINVDLNRADSLEGEPKTTPIAQVPLDPELLDKVNLEGGKADGFFQFYKVGDKEKFYCGSEQDVNIRTEKTFTCVYAGTHANIWTYGNHDKQALKKLGESFDASIYNECVSRFGEPRFGECVNFLVYSFTNDPNTVGFFFPLDLFSSMECDNATARAYGVNRDHNVLNINALWLEDEAMITSTLAHEFQHLLCFTGYFSAGNECDVWFNEAMSGYIEETLFPGIKQSDFACFHTSELIRYGQSLYNFGTNVTAFSVDIGVYGSVYLFAEYLKNIAGDQVFSDFHTAWRNTYVPITTFKGIEQVIPADVHSRIDQLIAYPDSYLFTTPEEEFMSKLTLSFYLSTLTMDQYTPETYRQLAIPYLLYDTMMPGQIEGGGRIIVATKDGTFDIPADADKGLIYVGLNEDMVVVTDAVCK